MKRLLLLVLILVALVLVFFNTLEEGEYHPEITRVEPTLDGIKALPVDTGKQFQAGNIDLFVKGFRSNEGIAKIFLYHLSDNFDAVSGKPASFMTGESSLYNHEVSYQFEGLPFGDYAIQVYHDENVNGRLDTGPEGDSIESFGFSRNIQEEFDSSLENIKRAKFTLNQNTPSMLVEIRLN